MTHTANTATARANHPRETAPGMADRPRAVIFDVDGTLALRNGRHWTNWRRVGEDVPNPPVVELAHTIAAAGRHQIIVMSGRPEECRRQTELWLDAQGIPFVELFMRPDYDYREDSIVKIELYRKHVEPYYDVAFTVDDRDQVVAAWRGLGLTCLQVAPGAF
jgi:hypothetical protein